MSGLFDALDYIGASLNKPGRAVRGAIGGRPDELAALLPFSDSLGITDPSRQLSGGDLFRQSVGSTGSDLLDAILGFGLDAATDPLVYAGLGPASRALGGLFARAGRAGAAAVPEGLTAEEWAVRQLRPRLGAGPAAGSVSADTPLIAPVSRPAGAPAAARRAGVSLSEDGRAAAYLDEAGNPLLEADYGPGGSWRPPSDSDLEAAVRGGPPLHGGRPPPAIGPNVVGIDRPGIDGAYGLSPGSLQWLRGGLALGVPALAAAYSYQGGL